MVKAFSFSMGDDGMALFAENVPRDARIAFEASIMAYPLSHSLMSLGYSDITCPSHRIGMYGQVQEEER